jgi:SAM-dependent methyltransferase
MATAVEDTICPACDARAGLLSKTVPHGQSEARFWLCHDCGLVFRHCAPQEERPQEYFDQAGYTRPAEEARYRERKQRMFELLVRRFTRRLGRPGAMIDFGCSYGHLGLEFKKAGWQVYGVDIAPSIVDYHNTHGTFPAYSTLEEAAIPDGQIDLVAMIDVIYYVPRPLDLLRSALVKLRPGGATVLRAACREQFIRWALAMGRSSAAQRLALDHTTFWSPKSMRHAAKLAGYESCLIRRIERGYSYGGSRKLVHMVTQGLAAATGGLINLATVFHAELVKGRAVYS